MALKPHYLYISHGVNAKHHGVGMCAGPLEAYTVMWSGGASSTDLGCSSEYSSETLEGRSGKWFPMNSIWMGVSRS